ncbi:hypothetical protein, partial [Accumulibacter sp.]|uniref:hypothetical protein n=1 Tax=Accumulibacter sp. TaxID=2053492 RepID=UPI002587A9C2
ETLWFSKTPDIPLTKHTPLPIALDLALQIDSASGKQALPAFLTRAIRAGRGLSAGGSES